MLPRPPITCFVSQIPFPRIQIAFYSHLCNFDRLFSWWIHSVHVAPCLLRKRFLLHPQLNWGALACSVHKKACWRNEGFSNTMESGDDLPSRAVSSQVLSACGGLTSVFGMGTGGSLQLLSPEIVCTSQTVCSLAPGLSRPASAFRSAHPENCTGKADLSFSNWSSFR